ncbi:MAG: glutathione-regulated potassium-efflux system ancillary protein KefC [Akkermansiaceae bacterium]|jgi:glutathione-regulated potassium-efflux system ancillary protein KefC
MDAIFIAVAFGLGLAARQLRLPPMVGFLVAGFVLQATGYEAGDSLRALADLGVKLLLFTIGLKLQVRTLARPEIWATTTLHSTLALLFFAPLLFGITALVGPALGLEWKTALLLAFAFSFSSTIFAIKTLEENGDLGALHGKAAIGILVMQDLFAVLFLTFSKGEFPNLWCLLLLPALILARPLLGWFMNRSGHGELLLLCGFMLALVIGAEGFHLVGLKADLGVLFIGVMVGWHPQAKELKKTLNPITDLLLIGFFLQVGLEGSLTLKATLWALLAILVVPLKSIAFFLLLTRFHLRARTAWMTSLSLSTYSEFGLIVAALGYANGWLGSEWLVALALALALSFLLASPLNRRAPKIYDRHSEWLKKFERSGVHRGDLPVIRPRERMAIFGMGRVGLAAYHNLEQRFPGHLIGFDRSPEKVACHREQERNVRLADASDSDFWEEVCPNDELDMVVLTMSSHAANLHAVEALRRHDFQGVVIVIGKYDHEVEELRKYGVDAAFNLYAEAGLNFGRHISEVFEQQCPDLIAEWQAPGNERSD